MARKFSIGRQKIKIAKIERKNYLEVTFSKRRSGLFKKASELCTLCGVEIAIVVFSPSGKVFSFGHPNVQGIIDRFLSPNPPPSDSSTIDLVEALRNATVHELNFHLTRISNELEFERKRGEALAEMTQASQSQSWWESPIDKMGLEEVQQLKECMEVLKNNVNTQANSILAPNANSNLPLFGSNGHMAFNHYEAEPDQMNPASHVPGYGNGADSNLPLFGSNGHMAFNHYEAEPDQMNPASHVPGYGNGTESNLPLFGSKGHMVFNHYEAEPHQMNPASHVPGYGYGNGANSSLPLFSPNGHRAFDHNEAEPDQMNPASHVPGYGNGADSNLPLFGSNGHMAFNHYQAEPDQMNPASHVPGYGYNNGADSNLPLFDSNGHMDFNHYEAEPHQMNPASHVPGYGYGNGNF